jgi:hypothetical protein
MSESIESALAGTPPKVTAVAPVKPAPVMTTEVPPVVGPLLALRLEIIGAPSE